MPLHSIAKKRKFVTRRHFTYPAEGNASMPHQKNTEFWVGGQLNTYASGPKKGQATGNCSILLNPNEGMNKMTPQLVEPYGFGETVMSASASLSPRTPLSHTTAIDPQPLLLTLLRPFNQKINWFPMRVKTPESAIMMTEDIKEVVGDAYREDDSFRNVLIDLASNRPTLTVRYINGQFTTTGATFMLRTEIVDITGARWDPDDKAYSVMIPDIEEAKAILIKLEELATFWGVIVNAMAPLALPKPQEFAYTIPNPAADAAAVAAASSAAASSSTIP